MQAICAKLQWVDRPSRPAVALFAVIIAALLTWGAYPVIGSPLLIWLALVPLVVLCRVLPPTAAFCCGLAYGALTMHLICHWIYVVPGFRWYHGLPLAFYLGLFPAVWCLCCALFGRLQHSFVLPGAALWVLLGYCKAHVGFLSFPWASLAHSQYEQTPLLQISAITGEYGVTFLIVLFNVALAEWLVSRRGAAPLWAVLIVGAVWMFGDFTLTTADHAQEEQTTIAVVQPSILRTERQSADGRAASFARLASLTESAAALGPDLILLPESALRLDRHDPGQLAGITAISRKTGIPIIFGASESEKFSGNVIDSQQSGLSLDINFRWHNSAFLSLPGNFGPEAPYCKRRLVPFGEYDPLPDWLNLPEWFVPQAGSVSPGRTSRLFTLHDGTSVAPIICWEILFADLLRDDLRGTRPDLIAHLSNSDWFGVSAAAAQQNSAAVFRAIEQRIPVVTASNTGPSTLLDAFGRLSAAHDGVFRPATFAGRITLGQAYAATFYQRNGNLFVLFCLFLFGSSGCSLFTRSAITDPLLISTRLSPCKKEKAS